MIKTGKRVRKYRRYAEDFKLKIVKQYESGEFSVPQMEKIYDISNRNIYLWIYKYSKFNEHSVQVVEIKDSQMNKIKQLEAQVKELQQAVGQKQMHIDFLEKIIDLASEEFDIDIKKNSNTPQSGGSKQTGKK